MADSERMLIETVVGAPPPVVWAALREPGRIQQWFGWDYDGLAEEIDEIFLRTARADEPAGTLTFPDGDRFLVRARDGGSSVTVTRPPHTGPGLEHAYDPVDEGWITFVQQLRFGLERHPEGGRRTIAAHGLDLGSQDAPLLGRLGLRPLGDDPVGGAYEVQRPDGSTFSGEVFFQTDLQIGLTVREEGDALLVVARTPPDAAPPHGEVMLILSTFGYDDDRFAEAQERWTRWWAPAE